ncbi:MAG TPA: MFS transporter [Chthoniobacterales bacterium]
MRKKSRRQNGGIGEFLRKTFLSLHTRNFRLFFIGQTISNTGNWLTRIAVTLLVLRLTHGSGLAIGFLAASQFGPVFFLSIWAGAIADRHDKRQLLLITQSLEMAQSIGLAIVAFQPHPPLLAIYLLAVLGGGVLAFDNPLRQSFVVEMVPESDIPNAVVLYSTIVNLSRSFGPALAGVLVVTLGYGWAFTLDAISYVVVIGCLVIMRTAELHREAPRPRSGREIREGLRYVLSEPTLWVTLTMFVIVTALAYEFRVSLPLFVTKALKSRDIVFTVFYSVFSAGAVVCALLVARRNRVTFRQVITGAAAFGVSLFILSIAPGVVVAGVVVFFVGAASILYMNASTAIIQTRTRRDMQARVLSLRTMILGGSAAAGGPFLGWIADLAGTRMLMVIGGIACLLAAIFGYCASRYYQITESATDDATEDLSYPR